MNREVKIKEYEIGCPQQCGIYFWNIDYRSIFCNVSILFHSHKCDFNFASIYIDAVYWYWYDFRINCWRAGFISGSKPCRFSASVCALLMVNYKWNPYLCMIMMPILGGLVGLVNGILVTRVKLNAWLVTLSMKLALVGIVVKLTNTVAINMPQEVLQFRNFKIFGLSSFIVFILVVMLIMQFVLKYTTFGRKIVAVGSNPNAASKLGLSVKNYKLAAFTISGIFAGLGGMLICINLGSVTRELGDGYEFTAVAAIVLGGVSLAGGEGSVFPKAFIGVLILTMIENGLTMIGADIYVFQIAKALIIFVMMYIDSKKNKI